MRTYFKPVKDMFFGTYQQRGKAALSLVGWFAMGAFIASTLEHHLDLRGLTEQSAAIWGGGIATAAAFFIKSV